MGNICACDIETANQIKERQARTYTRAKTLTRLNSIKNYEKLELAGKLEEHSSPEAIKVFNDIYTGHISGDWYEDQTGWWTCGEHDEDGKKDGRIIHILPTGTIQLTSY